MAFPAQRMRRLRRTPALRRLVSDVALTPDDLVAPLFVREGIDLEREIPSMPGVVQHSVVSAVAEAKRCVGLGIPAVALFGVPAERDATGTQASDPEGIVQIAAAAIKDALGHEIVLVADLCLDEYTDHGHCGVLAADGTVDNDATLQRYCEIGISLARCGVDLVAPSGMMDGQVGALRSALDGADHADVGILAYSVKYASALYGPFRDAVEVTIRGGGDRRDYQQDVARSTREALAEAELDVAEGADIVMVKPAGTNLDVIAALRARLTVPIAAYQVSGEYAMVVAASAKGWLDRVATVAEQLLAIRRAGADLVLTYFAGEIAEALNGG